MIKSKFNYLISAAMVALSILGPVFILLIVLNHQSQEPFFNFFALPLLTISIILCILIELPKIKRINIDNDSIELTNPITIQTLSLTFNQLDGYKTLNQPTRHGHNEAILIYENGVCIFELSELYFTNYSELKNGIRKSIPNLGQAEFKYFKYIIE